jgi:hypothetical protein
VGSGDAALQGLLADLADDARIKQIVESGGNTDIDSAFFEDEALEDKGELAKCPTCKQKIKNRGTRSTPQT